MLFWYLITNFVVIHGIYQCETDERLPTWAPPDIPMAQTCYGVWNAGNCNLPEITGYCCASCPEACESQCRYRCDVDFRVPSGSSGGATHSCFNQAQWGKCGRPWMIGYCCQSCNEACQCNQFNCNADIPPSSTFSCAQQKDWGKCGQSWMIGYCCTSCPQACQSKC